MAILYCFVLFLSIISVGYVSTFSTQRFEKSKYKLSKLIAWGAMRRKKTRDNVVFSIHIISRIKGLRNIKVFQKKKENRVIFYERKNV